MTVWTSYPPRTATLTLAVLAVLLASCSGGERVLEADHPTNLESRRTQSLVVTARPGAAYAEALAAAAAVGWTVYDASETALQFKAETPPAGARADTVSVTVEIFEHGALVTTRSGLRFGPNVRYVGRFLDELGDRAGRWPAYNRGSS